MGRRVKPYTQVRNGKKVKVDGYRRRLLKASVAVAKRGVKHMTRRQWAAAAACGTVAVAGVTAYATGGAARVALTATTGVIVVGGFLTGRALVRSALRTHAVHRHLRTQGQPVAYGPVQPTRSERAVGQARRFARAVKATSPRRRSAP